ncbi:MAG: hypothetical protein ACK40G_05180 [Cytophagaceae bacterium]
MSYYKLTFLFTDLKVEKKNYLINEYVEMWLDDGCLFGRYLPDVVVDYKSAIKVMEDREKVCEYRPYPMVFDCKNVKYWTNEAREFQNTKRNYKLMIAAAVIYTDSLVTNTLINFFMKFNKPLVPARFFTNFEEALQWIEQYKVRYIE